MAGTFTDRATLAATKEFIDKVEIAMLARAIEQYYSVEAQPYAVLEQARGILYGGGTHPTRVAQLVVAADATIKAAAPVVPSDSAVQAAVNIVLTALLR
jgi:hypothetical protein